MPNSVPTEAAPGYQPKVAIQIGETQEARGSIAPHARKGFGEAVVHSIRGHYEQRALERKMRKDEAGLNFHQAGVELIQQGLAEGENRKGLEAVAKKSDGTVETPDQAIARIAQQEYDYLYQAMFGNPVRLDLLNPNTREGKRLIKEEAERGRMVYRRIKKWSDAMDKADENSRTLEVGVLHDTKTHETAVQISSNVVNGLIRTLSDASRNGARLPVQLEQALLAAQHGLRSENQVQAGNLREVLGRQADSLGRMTMSAGVAVLLEGNAQLRNFADPILNAVSSALDGTPTNIVAARGAIRQLLGVTDVLSSAFNRDLVSALESRLNLPSGLLRGFMRVTDGVEDRYLMENPDARVAVLENMGRSYKRERRQQRAMNAATRHQWMIMGARDVGKGLWAALRSPNRLRQRVFNTKRYRDRQDARNTEKQRKQDLQSNEWMTAYTHGYNRVTPRPYAEEKAGNLLSGDREVQTTARTAQDVAANIADLMDLARRPSVTEQPVRELSVADRMKRDQIANSAAQLESLTPEQRARQTGNGMTIEDAFVDQIKRIGGDTPEGQDAAAQEFLFQRGLIELTKATNATEKDAIRQRLMDGFSGRSDEIANAFNAQPNPAPADFPRP